MTSSQPTLHIVSDQQALASLAAQSFLQLAERRGGDQGRFSVALSGGHTPRILFERLATEFRDRIPWSRIHFFWGDERMVPPDHPDSNFLMAKRTLLSRPAIRPEQIHPIRTDLAPEECARDYELQLKEFFKLASRQWPVLDLVLLGMGADGHTASLFPGSPALREDHCLVVADWVDKLKSHRITLTPPVMNHSRQIFFLVSGREKAVTLKEVLQGPFQPNRYPAQIVRPPLGEVRWFIDREAASRLDSPENAPVNLKGNG